jgi:hypothetical protein
VVPTLTGFLAGEKVIGLVEALEIKKKCGD